MDSRIELKYENNEVVAYCIKNTLPLKCYATEKEAEEYLREKELEELAAQSDTTHQDLSL